MSQIYKKLMRKLCINVQFQWISQTKYYNNILWCTLVETIRYHMVKYSKYSKQILNKYINSFG